MDTSYRINAGKHGRHSWEIEANLSTYDNKFYWRLYRDGEHFQIERDSVPQKFPAAIRDAAHYFTLGLNREAR